LACGAAEKFVSEGTQKCVHSWNKCVENQGDSAQKLCIFELRVMCIIIIALWILFDLPTYILPKKLASSVQTVPDQALDFSLSWLLCILLREFSRTKLKTSGD
jgi:hypothetical protein